jgi:hypothetical protein
MMVVGAVLGAARVLPQLFKFLTKLLLGAGKMSTSTSTSNFASILSSIVTLGGLLGPTLNGHSKAVGQAGQLLGEIQSAVGEGNWTQVLALANQIFAIQGLSTSSLDNVRSIVTAAQNAINSVAAVAGASPVQAQALDSTNKQLMLSEVAALRTQMASESQGIFSHLLHLNSLAVTGNSAG